MATQTDTFTAQRPASRTGITRLMVNHPITSYFALAIIGTWIFQLPMILSSDGLGLIPYQVPLPIFLVLFVLSAYVGPTGGAVAVTNALDGRAGLKRFFRRYVQWRVGILPYLAVLFGFPLLWLIAMSTQLGLASLQAVAAQPVTFFSSYMVGVLVFPALLQWGEEPGFRGFALTRMQQRYNPLIAALVVGLMHGLWHLPNHLMVGGPTAAGPFNAVNFTLSTAVVMAVSVIFSWVFNRANQSILIAVLIHSSFNAAGTWVGGLVANTPLAAEYVVFGLYALVALIIIIATRGRLGYKPQHGSDAGARTSRYPG